MSRVLTLRSTTVGKKIVMAVTGIVLVGFVVGHMLGNLKIFAGAHDGVYALDHYAEGLRQFGDPILMRGQFLWIARAVLLLAVVLHIWSAISLKIRSNAARPVGYKKVEHEASTLASRTMIWGGILLLVFIVFHLLHLTTGTVTPGFEFEHGQVQANMTHGLSVGWVAAFYIVAMIALGMHLYHGVWSMLQTLGVAHPRYDSWRKRLAVAVAILVAVGNIAIVVAVLSGAVEKASPQRSHASNRVVVPAGDAEEAQAWN